nr:MAG TPA: hypothetical protein [Caudoviricetes sp.]
MRVRLLPFQPLCHWTRPKVARAGTAERRSPALSFWL